MIYTIRAGERNIFWLFISFSFFNVFICLGLLKVGIKSELSFGIYLEKILLKNNQKNKKISATPIFCNVINMIDDSNFKDFLDTFYILRDNLRMMLN